jgi:hypothetical protein
MFYHVGVSGADSRFVRRTARTAQPQLDRGLLGAYASVALAASISIYGVLAYSVSQRTGEIGVRMALGATPRSVFHLIVGEGMKIVLIGIGTGMNAGRPDARRNHA